MSSHHLLFHRVALDWRNARARRKYAGTDTCLIAAKRSARIVLSDIELPTDAPSWKESVAMALAVRLDPDAQTLRHFLHAHGTRLLERHAQQLARAEHRRFPTQNPAQDARFALRAFFLL